MERRLMYCVDGDWISGTYFSYFDLDSAKSLYDKQTEEIKGVSNGWVKIDLVETAVYSDDTPAYEEYEQIIGTICKFQM